VLLGAAAAVVNAAFDLSTTCCDEEFGPRAVTRNATGPPFSLVLGGLPFSINVRDLIMSVALSGAGGELCVSDVHSGESVTAVALFISCVPSSWGYELILTETRRVDAFLYNAVPAFQVVVNAVAVTKRAKY
jgi:hypothetical protein